MYYALGQSESSRLIRIIRMVFGLLCIIVGAYWLVYNIRASQSDRTLWITVIFLSGFGLYQIWAGFGLAARFINITEEKIIMKTGSLIPPVVMEPAGMSKIEFFPLSVIFHLANGKKRKLRFGITYADNIEPVKKEIYGFADANNIPFEIITEEL